MRAAGRATARSWPVVEACSRALPCARLLPTTLLAFALAAAWPDLSKPPAPIGGGEKDAAVVVGVEKYVAVPGVAGAAKNAEDWYSYLVTTLKVPATQVTLLRDSEA